LSAVRRVGLISDTHDLLRPEARDYLAGCDAIVHAGDICSLAVLTELRAIAPVTAVRGNNDRGTWAERLPVHEFLRIEDVWIYAIHDLAQIDIDPAAAQVGVVVHGHSHQPSSSLRDGVLFVNPGSAGPRRFELPISCGELLIHGSSVDARLRNLI